MSDTPESKPAYSALARALAAFTVPLWSGEEKYHPSLKDHMHALGVAAANYNHLEFAMQSLFWHFSGLDYEPALHLFSDLNVNQKRLDNLKRFVDSKKADPAIKAHLYHFIAGFDICAENRNLLMHGMTMDAQNSTELIMRKYARNNPTKTNYMHLTVVSIRKIADEIDSFENYGMGIFIWLSVQSIGGRYRFSDGTEIVPTLPEKPPLPDKMNLSDHPIPAPALPPPAPSEG